MESQTTRKPRVRSKLLRTAKLKENGTFSLVSHTGDLPVTPEQYAIAEAECRKLVGLYGASAVTVKLSGKPQGGSDG